MGVDDGVGVAVQVEGDALAGDIVGAVGVETPEQDLEPARVDLVVAAGVRLLHGLFDDELGVAAARVVHGEVGVLGGRRPDPDDLPVVTSVESLREARRPEHITDLDHGLSGVAFHW